MITKFGGQPNWLEEPQWPISKTTGKPMQFICQIVLDKVLFPNAIGTIAYIFMADDSDSGLAITWEYEGGDNAVIIQHGIVPSFVKISKNNESNILEKEYRVFCSYQNEPDYIKEVDELPQEESDMYFNSLHYTKVGGTPAFLQGDNFPKGENWNLLCKLESSKMPFDANFGDCGTAYAFINSDGTEGRFMWQCY